MCKLFCIFLLTIIYNNFSRINATKLTEASRNSYRYHDQNYELKENYEDYDALDGVNGDRSGEQVNGDEEEEGGRLIGRWRNNGDALEPKWRDGDAIPLVPFDEAVGLAKGLNLRGKTVHLRDTLRDPDLTEYNQDSRDENIKKIPTSSATFAVTTQMPKDSLSLSVEKKLQNEQQHDDVRSHLVKDINVATHYKDYASPLQGTGRRYRTRKQKPLDLLAEEHPGFYAEPVQKTSSSSFDNPRRFYFKQSNDKDLINVNSNNNKYKNTFQMRPFSEYELNDEESQRPRPRKRKPPQNYEFEETLYTTSTANVHDNNHQSELIKDNNDVKKIPEILEIKSLLKMKQTEGLSLSEILQQRNLTLNDLLQGKSEIINALKTTNNLMINDTIIKSTSENGETMLSIPLMIEESLPLTTTTTTERPTSTSTSPVDLQVNEDKNVIKNESNQGEVNSWINNEDDLRKKQTIELISKGKDNSANLNDNEKLLNKKQQQRKPIIVSQLNTFMVKPIVISTTIKSITKDPVIKQQQQQHDMEMDKRVTTLQTVEEDEIMEYSDFSVKNNAPVTDESQLLVTNKPDVNNYKEENIPLTTIFTDLNKDSGSTLSIEHFLSPSTPKSFDDDSNSTKFDSDKLNGLFEYNEFENDTEACDNNDLEYQNDEPAVDNESYDSKEQTTVKLKVVDDADDENIEESLPTNHRIPVLDEKIYEEAISEIEPEARAEILELISNGSNGKRLEQLLKSRNMSLEELIALRQRGSSRVHLAEIAQSKSRSHHNKLKQKNDSINLTTLNPKLINTDVINSTNMLLPSSTTTTTSKTTESYEINSQLSVSSTLNANDYDNKTESFNTNDGKHLIMKFSTEKSDSINTNSIELIDLLNAFDSLPFSINYPTSQLPTSTTDSTTNVFESEDIKTFEHELVKDEIEIGMIEEVSREHEEIDQNFDPIFVRENCTVSDVDNDDVGGGDRKTLDKVSKVRPSIIASGAILGMTIIGFLAIFIVCRIRQKQRYMYKNSFSKAVFQAPVLNSRKLSNSSSINTIMVNVIATSTAKRVVNKTTQEETQEVNENFDAKSDIENDSLDANDSWDTIPDFMK